MTFTYFDMSEKEIHDVVCLLFKYIVSFVQYIKNIQEYYFKPKNYYIQRAYLVYMRNEEWDTDDITHEYRKGGSKEVMSQKSMDVIDFYFKIKYLYNSKQYYFMSRDPDHVFPPPAPKMAFRLPIKEAFLLDSDNVPMHNVTHEIKMYEGPHYDFHSQTISLHDMSLDDEEDCPTLRLVNILGVISEYKTTDSINHMTLWSQDKT